LVVSSLLVGFFCSIGISAIVMMLFNIYTYKKARSKKLSAENVCNNNTYQQISTIDNKVDV
jgi:hypothetical protein